MADVDVTIVGAGFGGMGAAIALKRANRHDLLILEREDDLGGTWHVNHYPGLAVDIASVTYSYSFEPNPHWKHWFARGAELKAYAEHVADKYDLRRHMRFGARVEGARWDEAEGHWLVSWVDADEVRHSHSSRFLMTATGFLSQPRLPDIEGVQDFEGEVLHTASWDDSTDLAGRRVAVIGTGATAVQLIPEIARAASVLTVFQRTPIWVTPKTDFAIPAWLQRLFAVAPVTQRVARAVNGVWLEALMVSAVLHYRQLSFLNRAVSRLSRRHLHKQVDDPVLRAQLTPDYSFGCKRPTFSNDYFPTFTREHVTLATDPITRITASGVETAEASYDVDTLVLATGFDLWGTNFPAIELVGRDGVDLRTWWGAEGYQAYEGVTVPGFPNFVSLNSPYSYSGLSYFMTIEVQMRHLERLFGELDRRGASGFEITSSANARFRDRMLERMDDTVFDRGSCATSRSYYFTPRGDAVILRPTSTRSARRAAETFPLDDYAFTG